MWYKSMYLDLAPPPAGAGHPQACPADGRARMSCAYAIQWSTSSREPIVMQEKCASSAPRRHPQEYRKALEVGERPLDAPDSP
ncbi:BQ5605_C024g09906 [Microbotryum silenes-dioicae]|uniref:BQ5605_C024g09906 protein n=1 Tax=Microbotryum silenes-dioicae TaxID=796604 RepID=A0A2X0PFK9_9BASI|nr:BQ5605_C024g09906 [Microbotryum silenes-dioicae]